MRQLGAAGPDRPRQQSLAWQGGGEGSIRSLEERDRSRCHSAHRGGLELSTGTGRGCTVRVGRPCVVWLCGIDGLSPVRASR